jgi:hypothetical protein
MRKKTAQKFIYFAILLAFSTLLSVAPARAEGIKVVELFTSQGCPSCPAADRIFGNIAENNSNVLALGCHVTYFDRRWRDSMSRIVCDARQLAYNDSNVTSRSYTPQVVINGRTEIIGNKESAVRSALARAPSLPALGLTLNGGYLDIALPQADLRKPADIWLFAYDDAQSIRIGGGANAGKTISYARPVLNLTKLLSWNGQAINMSFPLSEFRAQNYAVIAQYADYSGIVAAGKTGN